MNYVQSMMLGKRMPNPSRYIRLIIGLHIGQVWRMLAEHVTFTWGRVPMQLQL